VLIKYVHKSKYVIMTVDLQLRESISPNLPLFLGVQLDLKHAMFSKT